MEYFLLYFFLFFICAFGKFTCHHVIKTDFTSKSELMNIMTSKDYYNYYLEEVKADNITFKPECKGNKLNYPQTIEYYSKPKITLFPMKFPRINIIQKWNKENEIMKGNIKCKFIDFDLDLNIVKNESDYVVIEMNGSINNKLFFLPNKVLNLAINDYEGIFHKIIKKFIK